MDEALIIMTPRRILAGLGATVALGLIVLIAYGWYSYRRPLPQTEGAVILVELQDDVTIYRDEWGVPHAYSATSYDLFFSQGYLHAQDRWWQMEINRHLGRGTLSSILGDEPRNLEADRFVRTLNWQGMAEIIWEGMDSYTQAVLRAYTSGVNAYLRQQSDAEALAVEYTVLGLTGRGFEQAAEDSPVTLWEPLDSLAVMLVLDWAASHGLSENEHHALADWLPTDGVGHAWVVDGARSESGLPLLASVSEVGFGIPPLWYEMGLHCLQISETCPYDVVGLSVAGLPSIVMGHNNQLAWAFDSSETPNQEMIALHLDPNNPNRYEKDGAWQQIIRRTETIEVNNADPLNLTVYESAFGPLMTRPRLNDEPILALQWAGGQGDFIAALLAVNLAEDWESFQTAIQLWGGAPQTFLYADIQGNIGQIRLEKSGTIVQSNPDNGFFITDTPQQERLQSLLTTLPNHNLDTFVALQADTVNTFAAHLLDALSGLDFSDEPALEAAQTWFADWNQSDDAESGGAVLFALWWVRLTETVFDDPLDAESQGDAEQRTALLALLSEPDSLRWDDPRTPEIIEDQAATLRASFARALEDAEKQLGPDWEAWRWADLHTLTFRHRPLGDNNVVAITELFNRGPIPLGGGFSSLYYTPWSTRREQRYQAQSAPAFRMLLDLSDFENSRIILATGQSGHPASSHYSDQIGLWAGVAYRDMLWEPNSIRAATRNTLLLSPPD